MEKHSVKIKSIRHITHDVLQIVTVRPQNYDFTPGQATEISINKESWQEEKRPFTFTSLPGNDFLEFTIKTYPSHNGVTNKLRTLSQGDELILHDVFGAIKYKGEGVFIAGGTGVTPFISILRDLEAQHAIANNKLIFANKTREDIINDQEFEKLLGKNFINILSDEEADGFAYGQIDEHFLSAKIDLFDQQFYLCGPPPMMDSVLRQLKNLGVRKESITNEKF